MSISINRLSLIGKLLEEKRQAFAFRQRKHPDWDDNYRLYRLQVDMDRLTQRQETCIPLLKGSIKTYMSRIGDKPSITIEDKGGDLDKEIVINEKWAKDSKNFQLEIIDKVDKRQVLLFGASWKKLNWINKKFTIEIKDTYDMLHDPKMKPYDIETARYIIEGGIYRTIEEMLNDDKYDKEGIEDLRAWRDELVGNESTGKKTEQPMNETGVNLTNKNFEDVTARNERMESIGVTDIEDVIAGADIICHINNHITRLWDSEKKQYVRYLCVYVDDSVLLSVTPLKDVIGIEKYPFERWCGDDLEVTDSYPDSIADILRVPNQMVNSWYSQYFENRTLRNFGMNFYDATIEGFEPDALEPRPGGWYPLPGKPGEVYQRVDIPDLGGVTNDIQFLINMAEKETASSDIEKGAISSAAKTLGEIQIAVGKANERINAMAPFYNLSWQSTVEKWIEITVANMGDMKETLHKKAPDGKYVSKEINKKDLESEDGYNVIVENKAQKEQNDVSGLNSLIAIKNEFPNNMKLRQAIQKRALKVVDLAPDEIEEIIQEEEKMVVEAQSAQESVNINSMGNGQGSELAPPPAMAPSIPALA
jgi:hypothetical protein